MRLSASRPGPVCLPEGQRSRLPTATPISPRDLRTRCSVISNASLVRQAKQRQRSPPAQSQDLPLEVWLAELRGGLLRLTNSHQFTPPATAHPQGKDSQNPTSPTGSHFTYIHVNVRTAWRTRGHCRRSVDTVIVHNTLKDKARTEQRTASGKLSHTSSSDYPPRQFYAAI